MSSVTIKNHPGVLYCDLGHKTGSEFKYDVVLKDGWHFAALHEGSPDDYRQWSGFNSVAEFYEAEPKRF